MNEPETIKRYPSRSERARKMAKRRRRRLEKKITGASLMALIAFFGLICLFLLVYPKSKTSQIEKRTLATFPTFSFASYFSGDFTSGITEWYDDTVPFHDGFKKIMSNILSVCGFSTEDSVILIDASIEDALGKAADAETETEDTRTIAEKEADQTDYTKKEAEMDDSSGVLLVKIDGHWWGLSTFGGGEYDDYVNTMNSLQASVGDHVTIYSMPAPTSGEFYTPSNAAGYNNSQTDYIETVSAELDKGIVTLNLCDVLKKHTDESIYMRTDFHWSALGAYYAVRTLAEAADVSFANINLYTKETREGYVGVIYALSQDSRILNDPEDFNYYVPTWKTNLYSYDERFNYQYEHDLFWDTEIGDAYSMFIGGDDHVVKITTSRVKNGRKVLVVKDSFGNALAPFLTGSFEETYIVDLRYFEGNLINLIESVGITDVVFSTSIYSVTGANSNYWPYLLTQAADEPIIDEAPDVAGETEASAETSDSEY